MAETGIVVPSLEDVISRKLQRCTESTIFDDPERARQAEAVELALYNIQLNKDQPDPGFEDAPFLSAANLVPFREGGPLGAARYIPGVEPLAHFTTGTAAQ